MYYLLGQDYKARAVPMVQRYSHSYMAQNDAYYEDERDYEDYDEEGYYEETELYDAAKAESYEDPYTYEDSVFSSWK